MEKKLKESKRMLDFITEKVKDGLTSGTGNKTENVSGVNQDYVGE